MAAVKLLNRALSFLLRPSPPHHRHLSNATAGSSKLSSEDRASVLDFLRGRGQSDEALAKISPRLLNSKVGKELPAKFDLLASRGFSVPEAAKVFESHISLNTLERRLSALQAAFSDDAVLWRMVTRGRWVLSSSKLTERVVDNVTKLRQWGISEANIKYLASIRPSFFQMKPQCLDAAVDRAEAEFGLRRDSKKFIHIVQALCTMSESTMRSKFKVFESYGWERLGLMRMFKNFPNCFALADATLVKKLDFLINEVGLDVPYITKNPVLFSYSLEKRARPRFELVDAFKSKNLLPKKLGFHSIFSANGNKFREKYVAKFMEEEPGICKAYVNAMASLKKQASG